MPLLASIALPFLGELVTLFGLSVLIAYICYRIRLSPIVGFLIAGALVGPYSLGIVEDIELVDQLAEIGVILLLFTIGVEFSLTELKGIGSFIFTGGGLQVGLTVAVTTAAVLLFGADWRTAVYTGLLVALSSTAIVLGLLSERAETDTPAGRLTLGILIFQDLAVVAMVMLVPLLGGEGESSLDILFVLARAILVVAVVVFLARLAVPRVLEWVARTRRQDLFLLTVVAICFGTAWVTSLAGISLALGAFLAGLIVSESRFREQALSEILPLRTIFYAVFFVSVGMLFNIEFMIEHLPVIVLIALSVLLAKFLVTAGSILALGHSTRIAVVSALTVAQIGEFSFVLERAGAGVGLSPAGMGAEGDQAFVAVAFLLMAVTPFLMQAAPHVGDRLGRLLVRGGVTSMPEVEARHEKLEDHVIVVGYGPAGRRVVQVLKNSGIPYIVLELNPETVKVGQQDGISIMYGDSTRRPILEIARIHTAKVLVVAINDSSATLRTITVARHENPTIQIFARARFMHEVERFQDKGADIVVPEELETTVRLFSHVLGAYMIPPEEIARHVNAIRSDDYSVVRGSIQEAHMMVLQGLDEEGLHTRAVAVREHAPLAGKTLAQLELRKKYGFTVLAVRRGRRTFGSPAGDFRVEAGDRLVMIGRAAQFAECAELFRDRSLIPTVDS